MDEKTIARFWAKVDKRGPEECWPWLAARDVDGYGLFRASGKLSPAHRVAFFIADGRWPDPNALHTCDNRPCCNRRHLFEGTHADNVRDKVEKGRQHSVLSEGDVLRSREAAARGETHTSIARRLRVDRSTITDAVRRRTWRHI